MNDAIPEPVFPEADDYPSYRLPAPIRRPEPREALDEYVLAALVATGTQLVAQKKLRA